MSITQLRPSQIITLNDFPLHSERILEIYFRICQKGHSGILPYCPVIPKGIVVPYFGSDLTKAFTAFEQEHQETEFFLLDGSHRTTGATLAGSPINAIVLETDDDMVSARTLIDKGDLLSNDVVHKTIEENCNILRDHFGKKPYFQTVKEKTEKMVEEKVMAQYLIDFYCKK